MITTRYLGEAHGNAFGERSPLTHDIDRNDTKMRDEDRRSHGNRRTSMKASPESAKGSSDDRNKLNERFKRAVKCADDGRFEEALGLLTLCLKNIDLARNPDALKTLESRIRSRQRRRPGK